MPSTSYSTSPTQNILNDDDCCYRLRTLRITTEDRKTWEIYHWQYLAWGDHGKINKEILLIRYFLLFLKDSPYIPNQRDNNQLGILMEFFERFARLNPIGNDMNISPIIVHCSAGIGRSGATIAIDIILNGIRSEGFDIEIDIPNLIKHIRSQRSG